ncbi:MAG: hypothetical protein SVX43_05840 [Cyanobacteriota bacterium]|nr:hypothetical protein [Cyanobacteriota bacterium]
MRKLIFEKGKLMLERTMRALVALALSVVVAMALSPQTASATTCNTYTESNVTRSEWQCVKNYAESKGYPLSGDSGEESKLTCRVQYNYDESTQSLKFTVELGWLCPLACSYVEEKAGVYIEKLTQQCRG